MRSKLFLFVLMISSTLSVSFAACKYGICLDEVGGFITSLNSIVVAALGTLFLALAVVGFFLGVVRFIWAQQQGEEKGIKAGKETLKWGILALFCAFSVYGIITFGQNVLFGAEAKNAGNVRVPKLIIDTTTTGNGTGAGADSSGKQETGGNGSGAGSGSSGRSETGNGSGSGAGSSGRVEGGVRDIITVGSGLRDTTNSDIYTTAYTNCLLDTRKRTGTADVALCQQALENMQNPNGTTNSDVPPELIPDVPFDTSTSCTGKSEGETCATDWGTEGTCSANGLCG